LSQHTAWLPNRSFEPEVIVPVSLPMTELLSESEATMNAL
jgi:hypothetical protein